MQRKGQDKNRHTGREELVLLKKRQMSLGVGRVGFAVDVSV
jgi:hypothetical protein